MIQFAGRFCALFLALSGAGALAQQNNTAAAWSEEALLEQIRTAPAQLARIHLLSRFADRFAESKSLPWVLKSLQAEYFAVNYLRSAISIGQRILDLDPADIEAARINLRCAEKLEDLKLIRRYAAETWRRAGRAAVREGAAGEAARDAMDYAESMLAFAAEQDHSGAGRKLAMDMLSRLNPKSPHLAELLNTTADRLAIPRTAARGRPGFALDPGDPEALLLEAERLTRQGTNYLKVYEYSQRAIQLFASESEPPPDPGDSAWRLKRERYLTAAHWMSGMAATFLGRYWDADRGLRTALPQLRGNREALGITLYSLGYVNYQLAEEGHRRRIFEALRFNRECAAIGGPYRDQALKNIDAIKMFYNMQ